MRRGCPARRKLSDEQRQEVAERYEFGESMPRLAEVFDVSVGVIERALEAQGVARRTPSEAGLLVRSQVRLCRECGDGIKPNAVKPLCPVCAKRWCQRCDVKLPDNWRTRLCPPCKFAHRYRNKSPRLCRVCGRMGARKSKRHLCNVHIKFYCSVCETHMPPGRVNHRCTACEQARKLEYWQKPGARCSQCGVEKDGNHSSRCRKCVREEYEVIRWALIHVERPCVECGTIMPKGRRPNRCVTCFRKNERRRRAEHKAIGAHRCALCKEELSLKHGTYCPGCSHMLAAWRAAWHAGNPVARQLGTVRTQRRWQEKAAA